LGATKRDSQKGGAFERRVNAPCQKKERTPRKKRKRRAVRRIKSDGKRENGFRRATKNRGR